MPDKSTAAKKQIPLWQEASLLVLTALVMAVIVKTFLVQAFYIPSASMEPTLIVNDRVLVQKVAYWSGDIERGDIVVFDDPDQWLSPEQSRQPQNFVQRGLEIFGLFPTGGHLIKRVVGVGGDNVQCCDSQGRVTVNDEPLDEPYLLEQETAGDLSFEVEVPENHLWVLGDNRNNSADSRAHIGDPGGGFIPENNVVGKAWLRVWPLNRAGLIPYPDTFDSLNGNQ